MLVEELRELTRKSSDRKAEVAAKWTEDLLKAIRSVAVPTAEAGLSAVDVELQAPKGWCRQDLIFLIEATKELAKRTGLFLSVMTPNVAILAEMPIEKIGGMKLGSVTVSVRW